MRSELDGEMRAEMTGILLKVFRRRMIAIVAATRRGLAKAFHRRRPWFCHAEESLLQSDGGRAFAERVLGDLGARARDRQV